MNIVGVFCSKIGERGGKKIKSNENECFGGGGGWRYGKLLS